MKVYAIGDLHLGFTSDKPMDVFGERWQGHVSRLKEAWQKKVTDQDLVILCGDLSWAMRLEAAKVDLAFIHELPGHKVCIKGNHDFWWEKIGILNSLYEDLYFIQNKAYILGELAICGTRGWPIQEDMTAEDRKVYEREKERLKLSLEDAIKQGAKEIIVALHYPPTNEKDEPSLFTELLERYPVRHVVYGHLHDERAWMVSRKGEYGSQCYHLVAADYIDFNPKHILEIND